MTKCEFCGGDTWQGITPASQPQCVVKCHEAGSEIVYGHSHDKWGMGWNRGAGNWRPQSSTRKVKIFIDTLCAYTYREYDNTGNGLFHALHEAFALPAQVFVCDASMSYLYDYAGVMRCDCCKLASSLPSAEQATHIQ